MVKKIMVVTEPQKSDVCNGIDDGISKTTKWRNLAAFWILGLCNNYGYVVMLSAAHDIIESKFGGSTGNTDNDGTSSDNSTSRNCNTLSTGAILLADIIPSLTIKTVAPFLPFFVHVRLLFCVGMAAAGFVLVALANSEWLTIFGVVLTSLSSGLGEVTFLGYSHFYHKNVISTWSSGTGGAGVFGALSYATLKSWLSTETTLLVMLVAPGMQAIAFWLILVHPKKPTILTTKRQVDSQDPILNSSKKTLKQKLTLIPGLLKYMIPIGLVYLFEYFINQGLFELVYFEDIWLDKSEQYRWLQVDYQIGVFISRSSVNLVRINKIWLMAVLQLVNVVVLTFETLYFYIPNIWIVFAIVLWEGLLGGGAYVNTFYKMSKEVPEENREFSLGITTLADSLGIALAGFIAMPVHNAICKLPKPIRLGS